MSKESHRMKEIVNLGKIFFFNAKKYREVKIPHQGNKQIATNEVESY